MKRRRHADDLMRACAAVDGKILLLHALGISNDVRNLTRGSFSRMLKVLEVWRKQAVSTVGQLLRWFNEFGINRRSIEEKFQQHCQYGRPH